MGGPPSALSPPLSYAPACFFTLEKKSPSVSFTFYIVHNDATPHGKKRNFIEDVTYSPLFVRQSFGGRPPASAPVTPVRLVFVPIPGRASSSSHDMMIDDGRERGTSLLLTRIKV